jgi:uncharacterized membrane protein
MVSDKFRHQLRREAELWQAEGLIDAVVYQQLATRYQFDRLDTVARNRFAAISIGLGSILIGLGIITFVAANWQDLPRTVKVVLLLSLFIGVNVSGFYLWRRSLGVQQRLGEGLLLLGALILGANMGLMGQLFHISGPFFELLLVWGIGVLAMAYSLRLTSLGVLSIILVSLGYWNFWGNAVFSLEEFSWLYLLKHYLPLLAGIMFVPLAYWCRSRWIFGLAAALVVFSLETKLGFFRPSANWLLAIAFALPPALLWGYDDSLWLSRRRQPQARTVTFAPLARSLAFIFLGVLFFLYSFHWLWNSYRSASKLEFPWLLLDILILSGLAIYQWWRLAMQARTPQANPQENWTTLFVGGLIAIASLVAFWHTEITPIPELATLIFNVLLLLLGVSFIRQGLARGERNPFLEGIALLTLRILGWFLLANTGLLFKALIFVLCGVGVLVAGLWFDRYVRTLNYGSNTRSRP